MTLKNFKNSQLKKKDVLCNKQKLILLKVPGGKSQEQLSLEHQERWARGWGVGKAYKAWTEFMPGSTSSRLNGHFVQKQFYYPKVFSRVSTGWEEILRWGQGPEPAKASSSALFPSLGSSGCCCLHFHPLDYLWHRRSQRNTENIEEGQPNYCERQLNKFVSILIKRTQHYVNSQVVWHLGSRF